MPQHFYFLILLCLPTCVFISNVGVSVGQLSPCVNGTAYWTLVEECLSDEWNKTGLNHKQYLGEEQDENAGLICNSFQGTYECIQIRLSLCADDDIIDESVQGSIKAQISKSDALFLAEGVMKATDYFCLSTQLKMKFFIEEENLRCAVAAYQNTSWPEKLNTVDESSYLLDISNPRDDGAAAAPASTNNTSNSTDNTGQGQGQGQQASASKVGVFEGLKYSKVGEEGLPRTVCGDLRRQKQAVIASMMKHRCNGIYVSDPVAQAVEAFLKHACSRSCHLTHHFLLIAITCLIVFVSSR